MLTDITISPSLVAVMELRKVRRVQKGVWLWDHWNPEFEIEEKLDSFFSRGSNLIHTLNELRDPFRVAVDDGLVSSYGVCDGDDQLLRHPDYGVFLNDPRRFFTVFMVEVRRETMGDWRWHKWGPYIGTYTPMAEHLKDEDIDRVFTFSIEEHKGGHLPRDRFKV